MLGFRDPVADAIGLLRPRTVIGPSLRATEEWALRFEPFLHVRVGGLVRGTCWLILEGHEPVLLRAGDTFMLGNPRPTCSLPRSTPARARRSPYWRVRKTGSCGSGRSPRRTSTSASGTSGSTSGTRRS